MNVYFLSLKDETPNRGYWDMAFIEDLFAGKLWKPTNFPKFKVHEVNKLPKDDKAIIVIPARHHAGLENDINKQLNNINSGIIFLMGDEERDFNAKKLEGKFYIWVQNPHMGKDDDLNKLGTGYSPEVKKTLDKLEFPNKIYEIMFSGQVTHQRRLELIDALNDYSPAGIDCYINPTAGFTQGLKPSGYAEVISRAKVAPAPSGAVIPDSFRLFEALEAMAIVIADQKTPNGEVLEYWDWLFSDITPFIKTDNWKHLNGYMNDINQNYQMMINNQTSWWINYKREFVYKIMEQLA